MCFLKGVHDREGPKEIKYNGGMAGSRLYYVDNYVLCSQNFPFQIQKGTETQFGSVQDKRAIQETNKQINKKLMRFQY